MNTILIREAEVKDAAQLSRLSSQLGYPVAEQDLVGYLSALDQERGHAVFISQGEDKQIHGFVHVFVSKRLFLADFAELGGLVVDKGSRGSSHGRKLLNAAESWAATWGIREMRVRSNVIRTEAYKFYLRLGYQEHKQQTQNVFFHVFLSLLRRFSLPICTASRMMVAHSCNEYI